MTILYFLRALSELGVYYTLAGTADRKSVV